MAPFRFRLTVFMIESAEVGGPKATPASLLPVVPVKLPYETQSFRRNALAFCVLFVKHTLPLIGFNRGGMMKLGTGAPGRFANSWVAINVCALLSGGLVGNLNLPVSRPNLSKNTSMTRDCVSCVPRKQFASPARGGLTCGPQQLPPPSCLITMNWILELPFAPAMNS